nr:hypothetical protein [Tanacetum cinerariifolium]
LKAQLQDKNISISELKKLIEKGKGKYVDTKFDKPFVVRQPNAQRIPKPSVLGKPAPFSNSLERIYILKIKSVPKTNVSEGLSKPVTAQTLPQTARQAVCNTNVLKPGMYQINNRSIQTRAPQLPQTVRNTNPRMSTSIGVNHKTNVSRPQHRSNQLKDKVMPNNSQVKLKKTQVKVYPRIPSVSNKMKYVTTCKDSLNSKTLNANVVCATSNKCLVDSNHFACVTKILNDVNARTKKPNVVPISTRKPKGHAKKSVATPYKKKVASKSINQKPQSYFKMVYEQTNLQGNDLLTGNRGSDLYMISLQESTSLTPLCLMAKATPTQAWLWHQRLSHLNFDYINLLSKKDIMTGLPKLKYVKDQLCSSCELSKAKRSSFKSKAVPMVTVRTDRGTEFLNKTLNAFFKEEGIEHQTSTFRTPEQNGVVERRNRILVEAARTMLSASKLPLFFWAEAIANACYTQNRSIIIPTHDKTPYHSINDRKPSIKHLYIFGCICYITRDGENLDKMKEKRDLCILVGYSTQSKGYRVYNKRTRMIVESIHIRFDEIKEVYEMSVANDTSGLVPQRQKASDYDNPDPVPQRQDVSSSADVHVPSQQELDLLFGPLYDEFFNVGSNPQDKQPTTNIQSTSAPFTPTYVHAEENNDNQAEEEHLPDDEFTNPFCAPPQDVAESSSHDIEQVRGNPSRLVQTRQQLTTDPKICMFALTIPAGLDYLTLVVTDTLRVSNKEKNEEFALHLTNTMEWSAFGSCKDKEDADDHNYSFEDLISPIKEHGKESVPFKVREKVIKANTTPYLPTLKEPILLLIDNIRSKEDEEFLSLSLYKDGCSTLLEEVKVTHTDQIPPQMPQVLTNKVGMNDISYIILKHE